MSIVIFQPGPYFTWIVLVGALAVGWLVVCLNRAANACECPRLRLLNQNGNRFVQFHLAACPNHHDSPRDAA